MRATLLERVSRMGATARQAWLDRARLAALEGDYDPHSNFGFSSVQAGSTIIGSSATPKTLVLGTGDGAAFPTGDGTAQFNVVVWPAGLRPLKANSEIVRVTRLGDTLTTTARAQEGTTALTTIAAGHQVMAAVTAKTYTDFETDLAYQEFTANVTCSATTEGTANTIVTAPAFTADGTPVTVEFFAPSSTVTSGATTLSLVLTEDGTAVGQTLSESGSTVRQPIRFTRRRTPAAGSHTYAVKGFASAGSPDVRAGSGGAGGLMPGFVRVRRA